MPKGKDQTPEMFSWDFILDNGETIHVEYPSEIDDEVRSQFELAAQTAALWNCGDWMGLTATMHGKVIDTINMRRVVGWS